MDRWTSQLYVLLALVVVCAVSILSVGEPVQQTHLPIVASQVKKLFVDGAMVPTHDQEGLIIIKRREATPEQIRKVLEIMEQAQKELLPYGVPLGDPNEFRNLSSTRIKEGACRYNTHITCS